MAEQVAVSYPQALQVGQAAPTLTTSEVDILVITDETFLKKSQYAIYATTNLATNSNTSVTLYYYWGVMVASSIVWFPASLYATATGIQTQRKVVLDSTTYVASNVTSMTDNLPTSPAMQFKITGKFTGGSVAPPTTVTLYARDN